VFYLFLYGVEETAGRGKEKDFQADRETGRICGWVGRLSSRLNNLESVPW